jgi:hypothetical protein
VTLLSTEYRCPRAAEAVGIQILDVLILLVVFRTPAFRAHTAIFPVALIEKGYVRIAWTA